MDYGRNLWRRKRSPGLDEAAEEAAREDVGRAPAGRRHVVVAMVKQERQARPVDGGRRGTWQGRARQSTNVIGPWSLVGFWCRHRDADIEKDTRTREYEKMRR